MALAPWPAGGAAADGETSTPAEALLRLVYGRLDPAHTPPFGGEPELLDRARAVFPARDGPGGPPRPGPGTRGPVTLEPTTP